MNIIRASAVLVILFLCACQEATENSAEKPKTTLGPRIAKCTHAVGLCNLPLFISKETSIISDKGVDIELINIPNWADHAAALTNGQVDFSVTPFTNVMTAYAHGSPIKVIAGSGINGLYLLGARDIRSPQDLKGKKIGTFQADTLEMLLYSYLKMHAIPWDSVEIVYFTDAFELINAFGAGSVSAMTHVEPYAQRAETELGARRLASGKEVWGGDHPDCVLVASNRIINSDPDLVRDVVLAMLRAQLSIEENPREAVKHAVGKYYKASFEDILAAESAQPPGVDIRHKLAFMHARFEDLKALRYVAAESTDEGLVDFHFLEEVIASNTDMYSKLQFKAPGAVK